MAEKLTRTCEGNRKCIETYITVWDTEAYDGELPIDLQHAVHNW